MSLDAGCPDPSNLGSKLEVLPEARSILACAPAANGLAVPVTDGNGASRCERVTSTSPARSSVPSQAATSKRRPSTNTMHSPSAGGVVPVGAKVRDGFGPTADWNLVATCSSHGR